MVESVLAAVPKIPDPALFAGIALFAWYFPAALLGYSPMTAMANDFAWFKKATGFVKDPVGEYAIEWEREEIGAPPIIAE